MVKKVNYTSKRKQWNYNTKLILRSVKNKIPKLTTRLNRLKLLNVMTGVDPMKQLTYEK